MLLTASNDLSIGFHKMTKDKVIDETVLQLSIEDGKKLNDIQGNASIFYTAAIDGQISKYITK